MTDLPPNSQPEALDPRVHELLDHLKEIGYDAFQNVIALSRWPDGTLVSDRDRPLMMQTVLLYERDNVPLEQRIGFIFKGQCSSH